MWSLMCADSRRALLVWLTWLEATGNHIAELQVKATNQQAELTKTIISHALTIIWWTTNSRMLRWCLFSSKHFLFFFLFTFVRFESKVLTG